MAEETRQLGRYELIKRIAVGGMGVIYLAKSRGAGGFEKTVIIKKILDHLAEEEEFITKFLDEGRIVVNLTHGNIVPVFDMGEEDGEYFIAMEYLPGRDLRDVLKRVQKSEQSMPIHLAVHIVTEACKGLEYAHRRTDDAGEPLNIVHRDVSPSNVLISRDGEVKVIDFGIARATSRAAKTVSGRIQGKICYMSPEQAAGKSVDHRSDIFSMGVVLYEMLTGRRPFEGESDLQSLDLVRKCEYETPSEVNDEIPPELDAIVEQALSRDIDARYQSIDELHVELLEWLYSGGRAVTSQQLSEFVRALFPEGFEREELRKARDASSANRSADGAMNLDDALNAELEKLESAKPAGIDPLSTTATELADGPAKLTSGPTATLSEGAGADGTPEAPPQTDQTERGAGDSTNKSGTLVEQAMVQAADGSATLDPASTAESERPDERPPGFKRWLAVALVLGLIAGAAVLYAYAATEYGKVEVHTAPEGASIEVDGVKVSGAQTPHTVQVEAGKRAITVSKDGFVEQTFKLEVKRRKTHLLDDRTIELEPIEPENAPRQAWVTVTPVEAHIKIDNGDKTSTGKAKITVSPEKQVLVEASHSDCKTATRVVNYAGAAKPVHLELDCKEAMPTKAPDAGRARADASSRDASESGASAPDKPPERRPRYKTVRFETRPKGGQIRVGANVASGPQRLRVGQKVAVHASLSGHKTVDKELRVSHNFPSRYTIELEKLPTGCLKVRPVGGQQVKVAIDGAPRGQTSGKRFQVPAGPHKVVLTWGDGSTSEYDVNVPVGDECAPPIGFNDRPDTN